MGLIEKIKYSIMKSQIEKRKKQHPFDMEYAEMYEIPKGESNHPNNSYYFSLHDAEGTSILFRLAKRGDREELWFIYHDKNSNSYYNRDMLGNSESHAEVQCLEVGKQWRFKFSGPMIPVGETESPPPVMAAFEGVFTSTAPIFEFSRHADAAPTVRALAREKWSKDFVSALSENHQTHYEQAGQVKGSLRLDNEEVTINMRAMRDHSFGKREWKYMDRHIWLTALLETGEILNVNMVRYPAIFELQHGYLEKAGKYVCLDSVTPMDDITLSGNIPSPLACEFKLVDDRMFTLVCKKEIEVICPFDNGDYTILEGIGSFRINGVKGRGIIEFGYNGDRNRWTRKSHYNLSTAPASH